LLTRINVTPIIDVALVLVIILLITAPMLSVADLELDLPAARTRDLDQSGFVSITVAADGRLAVDDKTLADTADLVPYLQARRQAAGDQLRVVVRADERLPHFVVRDVMAAARAGGATRLGIATRQTEVILP
jgi:biopolymer transport protein ExbD